MSRTDCENGSGRPWHGHNVARRRCPNNQRAVRVRIWALNGKAKGQLFRGTNQEPREKDTPTIAELGIPKKTPGSDPGFY